MQGRYHGRDVHFCATCRWIQHVGPKTYRCQRLGYQTEPRWKFQCWDPRPGYTLGDVEKFGEDDEDGR